MATISLTMNACGGSSESQKIFYGKTLIVTGTGLSGTGWTLYTGAPISPNTTTVGLTGLDDNVEYTIQRYCNCPVSGDNGPEIIGPLIKSVCPTQLVLSPGSTTVSYNYSAPVSLNNAGSYVDKILIDLLDASGNIVIQSSQKNKPFSFMGGSFTGLSASTGYRLRLTLSNTSGSKKQICTNSTFTTQAVCAAPTVTLSNVTGNSIQVGWSVPQTFAGDTYNIISNGITVASGLPFSSNPYTLTGLNSNALYQIGVQRNCGGGGSATGTSSAYTTSAPTITQTCNILQFGIRDQCFTIGDAVYPGNRFTLTIYGHTITYTSIAGDNKYDVALRLADLVENETISGWSTGPTAPPTSTPFFKPFATNGNPEDYVVSTRVNQNYAFTAAAYVS